jgi:hypothetical protein
VYQVLDSGKEDYWQDRRWLLGALVHRELDPRGY